METVEALPAPNPIAWSAGGHNHAHGGASSGLGTSRKGMPNVLSQLAGVVGRGVEVGWERGRAGGELSLLKGHTTGGEPGCSG
jgi:hypothetical protein